MKKFKKISAGLLSLALLACIGTSQAFAADIIETEGGQATKDATVNVYTPAEDIFKVQIGWGALTYDVTQTYDAETKKYSYTIVPTTDSSEGQSSDQIIVHNMSNVAVDVNFIFNPKDDYNGKITGTFTQDILSLDAVPTDNSGTVPSGNTNLIIAPVANADLSGLSNDAVLGNVVVGVVGA